MIKVEKLENLNLKFKRFHGWSGADGVFSYIYKDQILWYFSDTFIGDSDCFGKRINFQLINNSLAISSLDVNEINFFYPNKNPLTSSFEAKKGYYWLEDGILINDTLYIYALKMNNDIFSNNIFEIKGLDLIKVSLPFSDNPTYKTIEINEDNKYIFGTSIIKIDNYFYVYGYINDNNDKKLILSRTKDLVNSDFEYLNVNNQWSKNLTNIKIIKEHFASEFKFVKIGDYFYCAYTKYSVGNTIYLMRSKSLTDSFEEIRIYECPEHHDSIITYNAKIQLALTNTYQMVISYNVNTLVNSEHENMDIYRPRFIKINMEDINNEFE